MSIKDILQQRFSNRLQCEVPLAPFTTLKIGGPAEFLLEAASSQDLIDAYRLAQKHNIRLILLAGCSNIFIHDDGLRGLVVINKAQSIEWHNDYTVWVESGHNLDQFVTEVSERGWADLTFAAGIPGSIGGAIVGGAGAFGHLVHEYLIDANLLTTDGEEKIVQPEALGIEYRTSKARERGDILLSARLGPFNPALQEELMEEVRRIKAMRDEKHPSTTYPSAGSFFKNLPPEQPGGRRRAAGKYLDEAGAKSLRVGDAGVFENHANIIVNYGQATAEQVNQLASQMAERVKQKFGIELEREVRFLQ